MRGEECSHLITKKGGLQKRELRQTGGKFTVNEPLASLKQHCYHPGFTTDVLASSSQNVDSSA